MQISIIRPLVLSTASLFTLSASAGVIENFNSRKGTSVQHIKASLQNSCWSFHHFDVNINGWNPKIEGDGAMVADINAVNYHNAGIYTPLLRVGTDLTVSFEYIFSKDFDASASRFVKICLVNAANEVVQTLETVNFNGFNATKSKRYSTVFNNLTPGEYRLALQYGGKGGDAIIAIDEFTTSAPYKYEGGCNSSPVALRDNITGLANRTASGSLIENDKDGDSESLIAFLIKDSKDGKVELKEDGTFVFIPNKNFKGNSTSFVYKVCDAAYLCSPDATVVINFPAAAVIDFKGEYKYDGNVEIAWTAPAGTVKQFELERSIAGGEWKTAATIPVKKGQHYTYTDDLGKNTALKKDLYYRLKQINADGSLAASRLLIVRVYNTKNVSTITVTPNPAKSDISVSVQLNESSLVSMRVIDASGATVLHKTASASHGTSNILVEGSSQLTPGVYSLEVVVNSKERMVVQLIKE